jgi:L-asparagine permease
MSVTGSAPKFAARMNKAGVPYGGIALTAAVAVLGVVLNALVPAEAFEIVLNVASLGIISTWAMIVLCQMQLQRLASRGELLRPSFRMPGAPVTGWLTLAFLLAVLVLMAFDSPVGTWTIASLAVIIPLLMLGWRLCRHRILELAAVRDGFTGPYPLVANRPGPGAGGNDG